MEQVADVLRVTGFVVVGLVGYTLVALVVLAWLGHRFQQFKARGVAAGAGRPSPPSRSASQPQPARAVPA